MVYVHLYSPETQYSMNSENETINYEKRNEKTHNMADLIYLQCIFICWNITAT